MLCICIPFFLPTAKEEPSMTKFGTKPDFRKLGTYCVCERRDASLSIEIRAKKGDYSAVFSAHDKDEAQSLANMLRRKGVDVNAVEAAMRERE